MKDLQLTGHQAQQLENLETLSADKDHKVNRGSEYYFIRPKESDIENHRKRFPRNRATMAEIDYQREQKIKALEFVQDILRDTGKHVRLPNYILDTFIHKAYAVLDKIPRANGQEGVDNITVLKQYLTELSYHAQWQHRFTSERKEGLIGTHLMAIAVWMYYTTVFNGKPLYITKRNAGAKVFKKDKNWAWRGQVITCKRMIEELGLAPYDASQVINDVQALKRVELPGATYGGIFRRRTAESTSTPEMNESLSRYWIIDLEPQYFGRVSDWGAVSGIAAMTMLTGNGRDYKAGTILGKIKNGVAEKLL